MTDQREFKPGQRVYSNRTGNNGVCIGRQGIDVIAMDEVGEFYVTPDVCVRLDDRTNKITMPMIMARDWGKVGI